ncbi:dNA primase [Clostridium sp. CAG:448]|nr:dNA primase [Clostridium sp. CAG:448]
MLIDRQVVDEIRSRADITEIIGSYVTLRRAGSNFSGLCPFHNEKSPSFTVFPDSQNFYCFGCNVGGDVITFIMREENLTYPEAVSFLAARVGVVIPEGTGSGRQQEGISRKRLYELNRAAAKYFHSALLSPEGQAGMDYLTKTRALSRATVNHFGLGFAPDCFFGLSNAMHAAGYTDEELYVAFLCGKSKKTGKPYDYFRNRVIFPIIDTAGNVVAFGGRVMDDSKPKYLNTNDTPVFKKGRNLFALNFAKNHCAGELIICEGYMDVIALHAAGFENAVASLGTALTDEQARLLTRYTKRIVMLYDSDEAGQRATAKNMKTFAAVGMEVRILKLEGAKDADEFLRKYGPDAFRRAMGQSVTGFTYKMNTITGKYNMDLPEEKIRAAEELCGEIATVYSAVEREVYVDAAAQRLGLTADAVRRDVDRIRKKKVREEKARESREAQMRARNFGDRVNPDAVNHVRAVAAEEAILGLLMTYPEHRHAVETGEVPLCADDFVTGLNRDIFVRMMEMEAEDGGFDYGLMGQYFSPDVMGRMQQMQQKRRMLSENGIAVLRSAVDSLREEKAQGDARQAEPMDAIRQMLDSKRKKNITEKTK